MENDLIERANKNLTYYTDIFGVQVKEKFNEICDLISRLPESGTFGTIELAIEIENAEIGVSKINFKIRRMSDWKKLSKIVPEPEKYIHIDTVIDDIADRYSMTQLLHFDYPDRMIEFLSSQKAMITLVANVMYATSRFSDIELDER